MSKQKILIASSGFFPENSPRSFRATELSKEFAREGHDVTVITKQRGAEAEAFCRNHGITLKELSPLILKPLPIAKPRILNLITRAINRVLLLVAEYPDIELMFKYSRAMRKENGYDLLISVAVPHPVHWGIAWSWNRSRAKCWVADCGDPYMGNESDSFKKLFYFKYIEQWMFRKADYIAVPVASAVQAYFIEFNSKIKIIPQGVKFEEFEGASHRYEPHPIPTFAYAGAFIPGNRDPRALLTYLLAQRIEFRFYLYTTTPYVVEGMIKQSDGRIVLMSIIPRKELIETLAAMDFIVNIENTSTTQLPSKLIDYYLAHRPVLSLPSGVVEEVKLNAFMKGDYRRQFMFSNYDQFRIESVCAQFFQLLHTK